MFIVWALAVLNLYDGNVFVGCSAVMYETGNVMSHARSLWKLEHIRTKYTACSYRCFSDVHVYSFD